MCAAYNDVLKRLIEERQRLSYSQKEMAQFARMSQSNYSKVELGFRRLSYHELQYLCESNTDIYYIFTGKKVNGLHVDFFTKHTYVELLYFVKILHSMAQVRSCIETNEVWKEIEDRLKYISLIDQKQKPSDVFCNLRRITNCQQKKMADTLGVDVKKLRDLENGRRLPDSELISRLYELYSISPSAILRDKKCIQNEIVICLERLEIKDRDKVADVIKALYDLN